MTEPELLPATLLRRWDEAVDLVGLAFEPHTQGHAASFTQPGQYVVVEAGGATGFFALASRPGAAELDLLIKPVPGTAAANLALLAPGATVRMSRAQGKGYPVDRHEGKDVLLFAVGSGISPIRSLVWWLAAHREAYAGVTLFQGARSRAHLAYRGEAEAWRAEGVKVVHVLSQEPAGGAPDVSEGYVQAALAGLTLDPARTVAFVCGMPAMVEGVQAALANHGIGAEAIFQNF